MKSAGQLEQAGCGKYPKGRVLHMLVRKFICIVNDTSALIGLCFCILLTFHFMRPDSRPLPFQGVFNLQKDHMYPSTPPHIYKASRPTTLGIQWRLEPANSRLRARPVCNIGIRKLAVLPSKHKIFSKHF